MKKSIDHYSPLTFQVVLESTPNAIILMDTDGDITYVNTQAERLFGYKKSELIGEKIEILIPERFRKNHPNFRQMFFLSPSVRSMGVGRDLFAVRKDGSEAPVEIGLNPVETEHGTLVLASIIDITERKKHETTINNQIKELEIKNRELEQFNYISSHDLQEPLRTLNNVIHLLEKKHYDEFSDSTKQYLGYLSASSSRMSNLVKGLLDYSRIGRKQEFETINCQTIIDEVLADLDSAIHESQAKIQLEKLPELRANATEIRLLFQNLINNAIKFCHKNTPPIINISASQTKEDWKFSISDNGIGIPKKYQEKIFIIFQRLHSQEEYKGTGIGLSHCQKIVESHGGKIWVDSEPDHGSTFYFTLRKK
jgi:PAS domain S-box-containing protein